MRCIRRLFIIFIVLSIGRVCVCAQLSEAERRDVTHFPKWLRHREKEWMVRWCASHLGHVSFSSACAWFSSEFLSLRDDHDASNKATSKCSMSVKSLGDDAIKICERTRTLRAHELTKLLEHGPECIHVKRVEIRNTECGVAYAERWMYYFAINQIDV